MALINSTAIAMLLLLAAFVVYGDANCSTRECEEKRSTWFDSLGGGSIGKREKNGFDALSGQTIGKRMFDALAGQSLGKRSLFSRLYLKDSGLTQRRSEPHYLSQLKRPVTSFDVLAGQALGKRTYFDALAGHSFGKRPSFFFSEN